MTTYRVTIKTQYHPAERIFIEAKNSAEAISKARRQARIECWFDIRNDGRVLYTATKDF